MGVRGPLKEKVVPETKVGPQYPILVLSRQEFVQRILEVQGLHERYFPGPISGPPFRLTWKGLAGGVKNAPTIRGDEDWANLVGQLGVTTAVKAVQAFYSLKDLEPFKNHKRPLSPDLDPMEERTYGTTVPNVEGYSATQRLLASKAAEIKAAHPCSTDGGHCFVDSDTVHIPMNKYRLRDWATVLLSGKSTATDPPPLALLNAWRPERPQAITVPVATPKPRGIPMKKAASGGDLFAMLTEQAGPVIKSLATAAVNSLISSAASSSRPTADQPFSSRSTDDRLSSPPPAIEDELKACLLAFGKARRISQEVTDAARAGLDAECYTPDIIGDAAVERLQTLTKLPEGHAIALRKFARDWCGKIDTKRARYST
ncbi:hypothetical protein BDN72DRAFT_902990 [Pluteus cervinus]|uniref:Uncharacterized protein n=1 Tax=Pluteus cervinus TaxID=181527 RepID=A0ACD3AB20_9AGAR|nr:hypothetical protein BDN72DRAFT_902990 [Pluteus cervinus]